MSNQSLSVVAYDAQIMGDLSSNPRFSGFAHIQSNLGVWGQKESGVRFPLVCIEGIAAVAGGYVVLIGVHLGELFNIHEQNDNGEILARHGRGAVFMESATLHASTKSSLDALLRASADWESTPVTVTDTGLQDLLSQSGAELRRWIIKNNGVDTGARFPAVSFGREKGICILSVEEVMLEQAISGFATSWQISSFAISGDVRFRLPGAGGSSSVSGIQAQAGFDINQFVGNPAPAPVQAQPVVPVQHVAPAPAAVQSVVQPAVPQMQSRFVRP